ncbi:hypothetical protein LTR56_009997 [Elasticomyces elasticus]|nr:hypothetical protein LTR56_009997 [Elasticomyces elasticus]KAK3665065.1 hypothetical protein LTR22_004121 [Elasticomyces elasticus]KAK4931560.1 hypothetical protein LTR49_001948 [Elasticomyces elasticus]KAK5766720.1 hypothetical protein LTS12_003069 [Elasticomyces elasticus]
MDPYYYARRCAMQEQAAYQQQQMLYQQQMQYQQQQAYQQQRAAAAGAMFGAMYNDTHRRAYGYGMQGYGDEYAESSRGSSRGSRGSYGGGRSSQQFHGFVEDESIHSDDSDLRRGLRRAQGRGEERESFDGRQRLGEAERLRHAAAQRAYAQRQEQAHERELEQQRLREEELRRERLREEQLRQERAYSNRASSRDTRRRSYSGYGSRYDHDAEERGPSRGGREPPRRRYYGDEWDSEDGYSGGWGGDYPTAYVRVTHRNWR